MYFDLTKLLKQIPGYRIQTDTGIGDITCLFRNLFNYGFVAVKHIIQGTAHLAQFISASGFKGLDGEITFCQSTRKLFHFL
ncbi:winged helix-turn-helix domain-containing protein [Lacrimispora sp. JR3]|uniref:winged helix-turn-helix domain-containing protein n=1 Tax=Lacrimispora sinapis TaxID=3111456 RepID=UPI003749843C